MILDKKDITTEEYREYDLGDRTYRINNPTWLYVGTTTHRIVDSEHVIHCIPFPVAGDKTVILRWKSRDPKVPVNF